MPGSGTSQYGPTAADRRAALKYGPSVRKIARRYVNPYTGKRLSGAALLLKLASLESSFDDSAVSPAGARGRTQFMPGSRAQALKFGVDPWGSIDDAYHGAALHLLGKINGSKGLEGYNPGDPAYPGQVLRQKVGRSKGAGGGAGGGAAGLPGVAGTVGAQNQPMGSQGALAMLAALSQPKPQVASSTLQAPAHSAAPVLPKGYQGVASGGGPAPKLDMGALLEQIRTQGGDVQLAPGSPGMGQVTGGIGASGAKGRGRVVLDPNADRPGARTNGAVIDFARQVSAIAGMPIRIGTGTRHSRLTVDGNVSDHWAGNAADIPATGRRLIRLGQAALIAAGMPEAKARKETGGLYTLKVGRRRVQVIFNTHDGGDHTNHLHVGLGR